MSMRLRIGRDLAQSGPTRLSLPEYRQIELYTKKKNLSFAVHPPVDAAPVPPIAGVVRAFAALDGHLGGGERPSWQTYLELPRATALHKLVAELYRILRVARRIAFHPQGHMEADDGIVRMNGAIDKVALSLEITQIGLTLLESAVAYYLGSLEQPYPDAYVEAMLCQYFADIVSEIKRFADEDRILYQFRQKMHFNRHFRFDCDNPRIEPADGRLKFALGERYVSALAYPIDFFVTHDDLLHIVPVEALSDCALALSDLPLWRARTPDGHTLPAQFRPRFAREVMVAGIPMT
jgi:hypothetical protein